MTCGQVECSQGKVRCGLVARRNESAVRVKCSFKVMVRLGSVEYCGLLLRDSQVGYRTE